MTALSFKYSRATSIADALREGAKQGTSYFAGGTDLMQLWKAGVQMPAAVVDISRLPLIDIQKGDGDLSIGAVARLSDVAGHAVVVHEYPLIAEAQYEISNFSLPMRESKHNSKYWLCEPVFAFGVSAHSECPPPKTTTRRAEPARCPA